MVNSEITKAVVKVGGGRGFIVEAKRSRLIITAAHCLPHFPPCHGASHTEERMYAKLLGPIASSRKPKVWAECLFADPVADIAILGSPDDQQFGDEAAAYDGLTAETPTLRIGDAPEKGQAWLLSLAGEWHSCAVRHVGYNPLALGGPLWIENAADGIRGGMSGSPIVTDDGAAVGIVCLGSSVGGGPQTSGGPNPRLAHHLPGWLLREMAPVSPRPSRALMRSKGVIRILDE